MRYPPDPEPIVLAGQTQGTRVTRNVLHDNCRDLFVEVSHGPYVVDHNIFASNASIETICEGGAYVANLIAGTVRVESVMERATPYHRAHSTKVAGYGVIYSGDDRFIGTRGSGFTRQRQSHRRGALPSPSCRGG